MEKQALAGGRPATLARVLPRICLIIGQLGLGGTEKQVVLLATGLRARGADVTVVVLAGPGPRADALREAGVPVVYLGLRAWPDWRAYPELVTVLGRLTRYLRRTRPDVVHGFLYHSYVLGAPAAWLAGVPAIVAGRRSLDDYKTGRHAVLAVERVATWLTHKVVANAEAVAACTRTSERVPAGKVTVIYNALPPEAFQPAAPAELDSAYPVLVCVANLKPYKGLADLVAAAGRLRDRGRPCTLVLVGEGPDEPHLRRLGARLGVDLRLLGARTDVTGLLARADVAVLPSHTEGMSNAVMEAMAAGRPVVATAVGGTPELLDGGRGRLVPPADPEALADAIAQVLEDPGEAARMGAAARDWCRANLNLDTLVQRHLALYHDLLRS
ncbi:MAG TPA: glycosyltransferase [Rugosimonospora sp.]|nr:glycosyltransferase [Rugosimonospora sp.]